MDVQYTDCVLFANDTTISHRNTGSQTHLKKKKFTVIDTVQSTTTAVTSGGSTVWVRVCVCEVLQYVSNSSPSTSLPCSFPPQAASPLLYE